jgi:Fe-S cluster assembly protein SufD
VTVATAYVDDLKKAAHERFTALGFPTTRDEDWHFTSVTPIAEKTFKSVKPSATALKLSDIEPYLVDAEWNRLVFVNGRMEPSLSSFSALPADVTLMTLTEALREEPTLIEEHLGKLASFDKAAFTAMNTANVQDGTVLRVPKGEVVDTPIHILHIVDAAGAGAAMHPRLLVIAEALSNVMLVESFVGLGKSSYFVNGVAEIVVGNGARVDHYAVQRESADAFHVRTVQVDQGRDSIYHSFSFAAGGSLSRANIYTKLNGTGGEARLNGLYLLGAAQHGDHQTFVEHLAESCASRELYCGVLDDQSHGVFNGKVYVDPIAQKTDGKQTNKALLLSPQARVDTKPQLEIFADDVKCTHGATVGRIDEMAQFYLKSRGIGAENARALLTYAFAAEALETIEIDALRLMLERQVFERFTHTQLV